MNLVPTNAICRNLVGDTATLPSVVGLSSIILEDNQLLLTSSEDIRCFLLIPNTTGVVALHVIRKGGAP